MFLYHKKYVYSITVSWQVTAVSYLLCVRNPFSTFLKSITLKSLSSSIICLHFYLDWYVLFMTWNIKMPDLIYINPVIQRSMYLSAVQIFLSSRARIKCNYFILWDFWGEGICEKMVDAEQVSLWCQFLWLLVEAKLFETFCTYLDTKIWNRHSMLPRNQIKSNCIYIAQQTTTKFSHDT